MTTQLPAVYLARHGETAWTISRQHTGKTDIALTERGERNAVRLGERLKGLTFAHVFTSPLQRARRTCELAGFGSVAVVDPNLVEWDYGAYEGQRTSEIHQQRPGWQVFRDGCPQGESVVAIGARADGVVQRLRWSFSARARGPVAGAGTLRRPVVPVEHGELEHSRL
jgi:probable phosphoglycerate mutase